MLSQLKITPARRRALIVDDDTSILRVISVFLEGDWEVVVTTSADEAAKYVENSEAFAMVMADHMLGNKTGFELLLHVKDVSPNTVRILMSGTEDYNLVVDAINCDAIFRFVKKPIEGMKIRQVAEDAFNQYQLLLAEKELLTRTLGSTIEFMNQTLAAVRPLEYGNALQASRIIKSIAQDLNLKNQWELVVAAMLSCSGYVLLPDEIVYRLHRGKVLTGEQRKQYQMHYVTCARLVGKIPRLERAARLIGLQRTDDAPITCTDKELLADAKLLRMVLDFAEIQEKNHDDAAALRHLQAHSELYDATALNALKEYIDSKMSTRQRQVSVEQLRPGMVLVDNVLNLHNQLLVTKGSEISDVLAERLLNFKHGTAGVREPLFIIEKTAG